MKLNTFLKFITIASLSLSSISPSLAISPEDKRQVYNAYKGCVFGLKGTLKISANFQGQSRNEIAKIWSNATNIGKGLLVVAYSSLSPNFPGQAEITKEITDLTLINAAGIEFEAKLLVHDKELDLAYIAVDPKGRNASKWKDQIVDISSDPELEHFDQTINISRYAEHFDFQTAVTVGTVSAIIDKPRKFYQVLNSSMSAPSFNAQGKFIGITISKTSTETTNQTSTPVTVPAKYIRQFVNIATEYKSKL